jgi:hypothetical protein
MLEISIGLVVVIVASCSWLVWFMAKNVWG